MSRGHGRPLLVDAPPTLTLPPLSSRVPDPTDKAPGVESVEAAAKESVPASTLIEAAMIVLPSVRTSEPAVSLGVELPRLKTLLAV